MLWHIVRADFTGVDDELRRDLEGQLATLDRIPEVLWLRVSRDVKEPAFTGMLMVVEGPDELEVYRTHAEHVPVVERFREHGVVITRLDLMTDDDPAAIAGLGASR